VKDGFAVAIADYNAEARAVPMKLSATAAPSP
jgi:hypothetical protein